MKRTLGLLLALVLSLVTLVGCGGSKHEPITDRNQIFKVLTEYDFGFYRDNGEAVWYGMATDDERAALAGELRSMFSQLGYDMSNYDGNGAFAHELNLYYDKDKTLNIFDSACGVLGIDGSRYAEIYDSMASPALDTSLVGIWNNNMVENTIIFNDDGTATLSTREHIADCTYEYDGVILTLNTPQGTVSDALDSSGDLDIEEADGFFFREEEALYLPNAATASDPGDTADGYDFSVFEGT